MARNAPRASAPRPDPASSRNPEGPGILDRGPNPDDTAAVAFEDEARQPTGARPQSEITGRRQPGTGEDDETEDGLSETGEAARHAAEDVPDDENADDDVPVFDEADAAPTLWDAEGDEEEDEDGDEEDEDQEEELDDEDKSPPRRS